MYPENFGFQLFIILQYFIREIFLKSSLLFNSFYCLLCLKTKVYGSNIKTRTELWMQKLLYLLFTMKRLYICYYIICLTVPLNTFLFPRIMISLSVACIKLKKDFIEITLPHGCSSVNLLYIVRTPFTWNISGRLVLFLVFQGVFKKSWRWEKQFPETFTKLAIKA